MLVRRSPVCVYVSNCVSCGSDCAAINYVVASGQCDMISKPINGTKAEGVTSALVQSECKCS